jgi:hypothetical protein
MAENLALSFACGRKSYLGHPVNGGPKKVLFLNLEEQGRIRHRRIHKQFEALTQDELNLVRENYSTNIDDDFPEFLNTTADWEIVQQAITNSPASIVFIDSVTHMVSGEIESSRISREFVERLKKYVLCENKTFIFIHHNVKGNNKPIDRYNIAGSRVITQSFHWGYGLSEIPSREGGHYGCLLFHKIIQCDENEAFLYIQNENRWLESKGTKNKFDLYKEESQKSDGRIGSINDVRIKEYILNQANQGNQEVLTAELNREFVESGVCSTDTLHAALKRLLKEGSIVKPRKGTYKIAE